MGRSETRSRLAPSSSKYGMEYTDFAREEALFLVAKEEWKKKRSIRPYLSLSSSKKDVDSEVEWFEAALEEWLDKHAKVTRVTSFSKR